jgi:hypothetical protein
MSTSRVCAKEKSIWEVYADEQYKKLLIEIDKYAYLDDYGINSKDFDFERNVKQKN